MSKAFKYGSAGFTENPDEDTVELELRPEHLRALAQASENAPEAVTPVEQPPVSRARLPPPPRHPARSTDIWVSLSVAAVLGMTAVAVALWPAEQHGKSVVRSATPVAAANSGATTRVTPASDPDSPMRFTNPFDASEVFEFPAGTTEDAARESVAEVLVERALERRTQIRGVRHVHGHRRVSTLTSECISTVCRKSGLDGV